MKWLACLVLCATGCGSEPSPQPAPAARGFEPPACAAEPQAPCVSNELMLCFGDSGYDRIGPLVTTDARSSGVLSTPKPGTICMAGAVAALDPEYGGIWSDLVLSVDDRSSDGRCIKALLDAQALGISSFEFELDRVPDTRLSLTGGVILQTQCDNPADCAPGDRYHLVTPDRQDLVWLKPGTNRAPLADFASNDGTSFDPSRIAFFALGLTARERAVDYDFCVSKLRFLDAAGREVVLPPL